MIFGGFMVHDKIIYIEKKDGESLPCPRARLASEARTSIQVDILHWNEVQIPGLHLVQRSLTKKADVHE